MNINTLEQLVSCDEFLWGSGNERKAMIRKYITRETEAKDKEIAELKNTIKDLRDEIEELELTNNNY